MECGLELSTKRVRKRGVCGGGGAVVSSNGGVGVLYANFRDFEFREMIASKMNESMKPMALSASMSGVFLLKSTENGPHTGGGVLMQYIQCIMDSYKGQAMMHYYILVSKNMDLLGIAEWKNNHARGRKVRENVLRKFVYCRGGGSPQVCFDVVNVDMNTTFRFLKDVFEICKSCCTLLVCKFDENIFMNEDPQKRWSEVCHKVLCVNTQPCEQIAMGQPCHAIAMPDLCLPMTVRHPFVPMKGRQPCQLNSGGSLYTSVRQGVGVRTSSPMRIAAEDINCMLGLYKSGCEYTSASSTLLQKLHF